MATSGRMAGVVWRGTFPSTMLNGPVARICQSRFPLTSELRGLRISTVSDIVALICVGHGSGEVRGVERSVASGRLLHKNIVLHGLRDHIDHGFISTRLCWTGLHFRAYTLEERAISCCTQECEVCR